MDKIRIGVIGMGGMGRGHYSNLKTIPGFEVTAISDINPEGLKDFPERKFQSGGELIGSGLADAVVIATPHFDHTPLAVAALEKGLHVLVEKPVAVHVNDARRMADAHRDKSRAFGAMFNMRSNPLWRKVKGLVDSGEIGAVRRFEWTLTDWFRSNAYYASAGWRATWAGEGGGILLNQCPHNLDLLQWILGLPKRITAHAYFGKYHPIEVEDEVTAFLEYENGMTGTLVMSTGEAPGINHFEIAADRGRLVCENDKITLQRNEILTSEFLKTTAERFARPAFWDVTIPCKPATWPEMHCAMLANFSDAIRNNVPLIAPAEEGVRSLELANAMLLSAWLNRPVELPMDGDLYYRELEKRIRTSKFKK